MTIEFSRSSQSVKSTQRSEAYSLKGGGGLSGVAVLGALESINGSSPHFQRD
jgi:hypothetical protein